MQNGFGYATIDPPSDVVAGSYGTWRLTYTVGARGLADGGTVHVYTDTDTDWGQPQLVDPSGPDYMSVSAPEGVGVAVRVDNQRSFRLFVHGRRLEPGEVIRVVLGDTRGGGPGSRAQTFIEQRHYFWSDVDVVGDGTAVTLTNPPCVSVVGDSVARLVVVAPSTVSVGESFRVLIKAEDRWGNPTSAYQGEIALVADGIELPTSASSVRFSEDPTGAQWVDGLTAVRPGRLTIVANDHAAGLIATSNPVIVSDSAPEWRLFWADPHGGQLVLNEKFAGFFQYARDVAGIQFVGFQRNADVISGRDWEVQQRAERDFYEPGRFIPIPGFEWSGQCWQGGHHNVYFRRYGQPVRRNAPAETMFQSERAETELAHIKDVYRVYRNSDVLITPHVGGIHSDLSFHDPTLEPAVEIVSSHGMFEWMLHDAIGRGYRLGFLGGSDSYTGRPGDDRPGYQMRRYSKAGLTGIYAGDVTLEAFHEAMRSRRVFATTGARMVLRLEGDGHFMGSEYTTTKAPTLTASVVGTAPLERVELFRGLELVHRVPLEQQPVPNRVRILWQGSSRMTSYSGIVWDGVLHVRGAKILKVVSLRFDSPRSQILEQSEGHARWRAWGCGYPMALVLDLEDATDALFDVAVDTQTITGPAYGGHGTHHPRRISLAPAESGRLQASLRELRAGRPAQLDLGVLDRKLEISLVSDSPSSSAECVFTDESPAAGLNPYWMRVVQSDLEMGWTSPVFIDYCPKA